MGEFRLRSYEFRREREESWKELETLIDRIDRLGLASLSPERLARLASLYRAAVSSLSVARAISLDRALIDYLENLAVRACFCVYGVKTPFGTAIANFFAASFPAAVWRTRWFVLAAALVFLAGVITGFAMTTANEDRFYTFVDRGLAGDRGPSSSREELREVLFSGEEQSGDELAVFSALLFRNNAGIGLLAFALGTLAGVPVFLLEFANGGMLGAFAALHHARDLDLELWSWLLPHGVTELGAVILCGGAGFVLGHALLFPGRSRRRDRLAEEGRIAARVVIGCVALFFIAGLIEGVFRQRVQSIPVRYAFAAATTIFWFWYFCVVGRRAAAREAR